MQIYELKDNIREKVILDVNIIGTKSIISFDHYLYQFPLTKTLVYSYVKYSKSSLNISELHKMFSLWNTIEWFSSDEHHSLMKTDKWYKKVYVRYVRNVFTWTTSIQPMQSHFFDAKYLLIGEYQSIAKTCAKTYFDSQFNHYTIPYSTIKYLETINLHNAWFLDRNKIENEFFTSILKNIHFNNSLRITWYYKYIEFYDDSSTLTLQFCLNEYSIDTKLIWPVGSSKHVSKDNNSLLKFFQRHSSVFALYQKLSNSLTHIQSYFAKLNSNINKHSHSYELLLGVMTNFISDLHNKVECAYLEDHRVTGYAIHQNSIERVSFHAKNNTLRMYRKIKWCDDVLNRNDTIAYSSYMMKAKSIEEQSIELLHSGFICWSHIEERYSFYDFELLSTGKSKEFAIQYFKMPPIDAMQLFEPYIYQLNLLDAEIQHCIESNSIIEDTRCKDIEDDYISTTFELKSKSKDEDEFKSSRKRKLNMKRQHISKFIKTYKQQIQHFTNEKIE